MALANFLLLFLILFVIYIFFIRQFIFRFKKFKCLRCGQCCKLRVKLSKEDIARIKKAGKNDFVEEGSWLKRTNGYCQFLEIKKGKARCTIYNSRPEICRWWPVRKFSMDTRCKCFERKII